MRTRNPARRHAPARLFGLVLAVLAFVGQLAVGAILIPDDADAHGPSSLAALTVICTGEAPVRSDHGPSHHRHPDGRAVCPLGVALALPSAMPVSEPVLPAPAAPVPHRFAALRTAQGPPSHASGVGLPRGPPILA